MEENDIIQSFQIESSYDNHENKRSLNYSLAIPSFHESLELLLVEEKAKRENLAFRSRFDFFVGCVLLFLMIVPCSIIAPLTLSLPAKDTFIKSSWRFQGCTVLAIPTTIFINFWLL